MCSVGGGWNGIGEQGIMISDECMLKKKVRWVVTFVGKVVKTNDDVLV